MRRWTVEDGLPVLAVGGVRQDREGYLWLVTHDGLVRFDGARFTVFDSGTTPALSTSRIEEVKEAGDGSLWILTERGHLVRYRDGTFTPYSAHRHFAGAPVVAYHIDAAGGVWAGTAEGVYRFMDERFERLAPEVLTHAPIHFVDEDDGAVWVGTRGGGAFRIDGGRVTARTRRADDPAQSVTRFWEGPGDTLWYRTFEGIGAYAGGQVLPGVQPVEAWVETLARRLAQPVQRLYDEETGDLFLYVPGFPHLFTFLPRAQKHRYTVVQGPKGHDWFLFGGLLYRDGTPVFDVAGTPTGLTVDHEGNLWLASTSGLYQLSPAPFTAYGADEGLSAASSNAYGLLQSRDGAIWAALLGGGVSRFHEGRFTHIPEPELALTLYEDADGAIWVGHYGGLCRLAAAPEPGAARPACRDVPALGGVPVRAITRYAGALWAGTEQGLFRQTSDGTWQRFTTADGLSDDYVRVFLADQQGALWMGTADGGVMRYAEGHFSHLTTADGLPSNSIRALYQDADGLLWVGTENRGLARVVLDAGTGLPRRVTPIRQRDGLFDDGIHQILEDARGRLWMSTNRGIFHVRRAELNAFAEGRRAQVFSTVYDERHGMRRREANGGVQNAGLRARDGRLWFPTQAGLVVVDPATIDDLPLPPSVVIESVRVADTTVVRPEHMALPLGARRLEVRYTAPAFRNPQGILFQYRLHGFDEAWIDAGASRVATYTNVPPGRYRFEVRAAHVPGAWKAGAVALSLTVPAHVYETRWFLLLMSLGAVAGAVAAFRWRLRWVRRREDELEALVAARTLEVEVQKHQLERQAEQLLELDQAKSRFFANISHEFRTPLTLAMVPLDELRHRLAPDGEAHALVDQALLNNRRLLRLVNQLLDVARLEEGTLRLAVRPVPLPAYLSSIALAFAGLAERKGVVLHTRFPSDLVPVYADVDQLEKIVTNLLANAFKFTPAGGTVELALVREAEQAAIMVRDTGVGIPAEQLPHVFERFFQADAGGRLQQAGTGIGLALVRELAERHGGTVEVASEPERGTTFTVRLPLGRAHLAGRADVDVSDEPLRIAEPGPEAGPLALPELSAVPSGDGAPALDAGEDRTTVLVVDDNAEIRALVRRHLAPHYRILEAADGAAALRTARRMTPDAIISDVMMPVMDGVALVQALRADPELDFVPVILLTARAEQADKLDGLTQGADDYLTKPFDAPELLARVRNLIALRHRLQREIRAHAGSAPPSARAEVVSEEEAFAARMREAVEAHLSDEDFGIDALAEALGVSRATLYRRVRAATEATPAEYLRTARLERARALLEAQAGNVSEIAYAVGFRSVPHFITSFRDHTGETPAVYAARHLQGDVQDS